MTTSYEVCDWGGATIATTTSFESARRYADRCAGTVADQSTGDVVYDAVFTDKN